MKALRCTNCGVVFIGATGPGDDAVYQSFKAHMMSHQIVGAPSPAAPLPTTHGSVSVERGTLARPADGLDPARHPSAGVRTRRGGAA
jgi:hypothetical protein